MKRDQMNASIIKIPNVQNVQPVKTKTRRFDEQNVIKIRAEPETC